MEKCRIKLKNSKRLFFNPKIGFCLKESAKLYKTQNFAQRTVDLHVKKGIWAKNEMKIEKEGGKLC